MFRTGNINGSSDTCGKLNTDAKALSHTFCTSQLGEIVCAHTCRAQQSYPSSRYRGIHPRGAAQPLHRGSLLPSSHCLRHHAPHFWTRLSFTGRTFLALLNICAANKNLNLKKLFFSISSFIQSLYAHGFFITNLNQI